MFRKRTPKNYPPGTFISTPARICAIIQLCLAFTVLIWNLALPFTGEHYSLQSKLLLYQDVMGIPRTMDGDAHKQTRLLQNAQRFAKLPAGEKATIIAGYQKIQAQVQRSFVDKMTDGLRHLLFEMPGFVKIWLILSFVIPILLLKRIEGAKQAVWLLPLLTACYAFQNRWEGSDYDINKTETLFPSEQVLSTQYMSEPLSDHIFEQREQLLHAWKVYLVKQWSSSLPASEPEIFEKQVAEGEFAFNAKRLQHPPYNLSSSYLPEHLPRESLFLLGLYFFWNLFFAVIARTA